MNVRTLRIAATIGLLATALTVKAAALDPAFGDGGKRVVNFHLIEDPHGILVQPDGAIAFGDANGIVPGQWQPAIGRLDASGSLDASFGTGGQAKFGAFFVDAFALARAPDGSLYQGGRYDQLGLPCMPPVCQGVISRPFLGKVSSSGVEDGAFDANAAAALAPYTASGGIVAVDVQADGKVLALEQKHIIRFNTDGTIDRAIDPVAAGSRLSDDGAAGHGILAQADGSILVGRFTGYVVAFDRYSPTGTLLGGGSTGWPCDCIDWGPNPPGMPIFFGGVIAQQADGKILVGGSTWDTFGIARFQPDGTLDTTYGTNGVAIVQTPGNSTAPYSADTIRALAIGPDGKAVVLTAAMDVYRLTTSGQPDTSFGPAGRINVYAGPQQDGRSVAVQPDGKVVVLASIGPQASGPTDAVIARIDPLITPPFATDQSSIDFGFQSALAVSNAVTVTVTNTSGSPTSVSDVSASPGFAASSTCGTLAPGASCTIDIAAAPDGSTIGTVLGAVTITAGGVPVTLALRVNVQASFVTHYYQSILHRAPDAAGNYYWTDAANTLGLSYSALQEAWYAMGLQFFGSAEYANQHRTDAQFLDDLYEAFFARPGDSGGLAYWQSQLDAGLTREMVLTSFLFSPEFVQMTGKMDQLQYYTQSHRAETNMTLDFYRGILARVPDKAGLDFWLKQMRDAQCGGASSVRYEADQISQAFLNSPEYAARARTDAQYVGDLYNAFLRRGADASGFLYWVGQLQSHAVSREQLRQVFLASPEFSARVDAVIAQGCLLVH